MENHYYAETEIAYEMKYTVNRRYISIDKTTGARSLGAEITYDDNEDAEYPYTTTTMDTFSDNPAQNFSSL